MSSSIGQVSVVVRCYNREETLGRALESICGQTFAHHETIVVDDGSTDRSGEVAARYSNVRYHHQANQGVVGARRAGLKLAEGEFIAFLDADDFWSPDFLETSLNGLEQTGGDFVFTNWTTAGPGVVREENLELDRVDYLKNVEHRLIDGWHFLSPATTRSLFMKHFPAVSSAAVFRRGCLSREWDSRVRVADNWVMVLDAIIRQEVSCAFHFDKRWTRWIDGRNICEGTADMGQRARNEIHDAQCILEQFTGALTNDEVSLFHRMIRSSSFDLGYIQSRSGNGIDALRHYWGAFGGRPWSEVIFSITKIPYNWWKSRVTQKPG